MTPRHFAWQAWHKLTSTVVLRGRRGTSTVVLRGRRGTNSHLSSFCVAGVAQTHIYRRFCVAGVAQTHRWQAWHRWQHKRTSTFVSRGSDMFSASFRLFFSLVYVCHVPACLIVFRHVLWSLWHVLFSDMLPASLCLFCWLVYACPVWSLRHVVFIDMFSALVDFWHV